MNYNKAKYKYGYFTRKCRKSDRMVTGVHKYHAYFHFNRRSIMKPERKQGNLALRRYKGEVSDFGWYKKVYDVLWNAY